MQRALSTIVGTVVIALISMSAHPKWLKAEKMMMQYSE